MNDYQLKNIIAGSFIWLIAILVLITAMKSIVDYNSNNISKEVEEKKLKIELEWFVQVASFYEINTVKNLVSKLKKKGYQTNIVHSYNKKGLIRAVRVGPYNTHAKANKVILKLKKEFKVKPIIITSKKELK